jgi:signal transduction histidine kinase
MIPLFLSVWDGEGIIAGIFFSIICAFGYFYTQSLLKNLHWHGLYILWESIIVWVYFLVFILILDKLKRTNLSLLRKNEELEKINNQKDKFFSIIAHDLKGPFVGFLGLTKIFAEEAGSFSAAELSRLGDEMNKSAKNLFDLLKNLLEWAQMQKGEISFQPKEFPLSDLIAENVKLMKKRSEQKGIKIINTVTSPLDAYIDEKMINSVLLNLLSNAVKFTHRDGTVTISYRKTEDLMIEISISDTGIGMKQSAIEKLFKIEEKYGTKGTDEELSTGLGLLLCKEFVEKHGCKIWVESRENIGSAFYFTLHPNPLPKGREI